MMKNIGKDKTPHKKTQQTEAHLRAVFHLHPECTFYNPGQKISATQHVQPYLREEKSLPMQVWTGRRIIRTAIPARHDGPISIHRSTVTATA